VKTVLMIAVMGFLSTAWADVPGRGGGCSETCSLKDGPKGQTEAEFRSTVQAWLKEPVAAASLPLETLLFYGDTTRDYLNGLDGLALSTARRAFLMTELARDQVAVEMRVVDDQGRIRGTMQASDVPFGKKQHLRFKGTGTLGHLETGGRVKRVGLAHLWSRW